jgi:hypothetical protein
MQTGNLINALAADSLPERIPSRRSVHGSMLAGALVAIGFFLLTMGVRPDFADALRTPRFPFKFVVTLALVLSMAPQLVRVASPLWNGSLPRKTLLAAPVLLLVAVVIELFALPPGTWVGYLVGSNALLCLSVIPLLSVPTAAALLLAMRRGAPTQPRVAGAFCGLVAAGVAATIYASHCVDDSPLFVATWYTLAVVFVTCVTAGIGGRLLRW